MYPVKIKEVWYEYNIQLYDIEEIQGGDAIIFAVPHEEFKSLRLEDVKKMYGFVGHASPEVMAEAAVAIDADEPYILIDVKGMFNRKEAEDMGFLYWRL